MIDHNKKNKSNNIYVSSFLASLVIEDAKQVYL